MVRRLCLVVVAGAACAPTTAHATDYCVAPNTTCGGSNVATFEAALAVADNLADADRVFLGAATYTAPTGAGYSYAAPSFPVEVVGAGVGQTVLTAPLGATTAVLTLQAGAGSTVHDLSVRIPQNVGSGFFGLDTTAAVERVEVTESPTQASLHSGLRLTNGASANHVSVTLGPGQATWGVVFYDGGESLSDATVGARTAVLSFGGTIERAFLRGTTGIDASTAVTNVTDTLITGFDGVSFTGLAIGTQSGGNTTLNGDGLTIIGNGENNDVGVYANNGSATTQHATANLADTVIRSVDSAVGAYGEGTGTANISASYSDLDPAGNVDSGPGTVTMTNNTNVGDARFVDAAAGDFRLRADSPLIDIGEPGPTTTPTDLAGLPRLVDGDGGDGARRDVGAYEFQPHDPSVSIAGPATATRGAAVSFTATGTDPDPGDALTYAWTVDGAAAGTAATLPVTFAAAGAHSVAVTVTDLAGRTATATHSVAVSAPPGGGTPPPPPVADKTVPGLSALSVTPARVRRGRTARVGFTLTEAAIVRVEIQRARPGRRQGGTCRKPSPANRRGRRCTRYVRVLVRRAGVGAGAGAISFTTRVNGRAMPAGTYRAVVTATDAAGNASASRRITFRVVAK